jgi:hypothetical protein
MANKVHWKLLNANSVQFFFCTHLLRSPPPQGGAPHTLGTTGLRKFYNLTYNENVDWIELNCYYTSKRPLWDVGVCGRIILKRIFKILCEVVDWIHLASDRVQGGSCEHGSEHSRAIKAAGYRPDERVLVCQGAYWLCRMELGMRLSVCTGRDKPLAVRIYKCVHLALCDSTYHHLAGALW